MHAHGASHGDSGSRIVNCAVVSLRSEYVELLDKDAPQQEAPARSVTQKQSVGNQHE